MTVPLAAASLHRPYPAGERQAIEVPVGSRVMYGPREVGVVTGIDRMKMFYEGFSGKVGSGPTGEPLLKFTLKLPGARYGYLYRAPHEPMMVLEV